MKRVTASVLILPVTSDRTHPIELSEKMRDALTQARVVYAPLDSIRGHSAVFRPAGTPEYEFVSEKTRNFISTLR
jgi:homoserine acetyltransferase